MRRRGEGPEMKRNLILKSLFETSLEFEKNLFNKTYGIRTLSSTRDKDFFVIRKILKLLLIYISFDRSTLFKTFVVSLNKLKSISIYVTGRYIRNDPVGTFAYVVRIN